MLTLKYRKTGSACFISHIDMLRHTSRILRRAGIKVNYSNGFNPHALVYFSPPLVVGIGSRAEYLTVDTDMAADEVLERYNASVPDTLRASEIFVCQKNPNLQGRTVSADYVLDTPYTSLDLSGGLNVTYEKKGQTVCEDVADKIYGVLNEDGKLCLRLASGNINLRPDRILPALNEKLGLKLALTDIVKVRQLVDLNGVATEADEYLKMNL